MKDESFIKVRTDLKPGVPSTPYPRVELECFDPVIPKL